MRKPGIVIIGAGPYGLSISAHLAARNIEHRIFGQTMQFWSQIAAAGGDRYLKSYCFGSNISTPVPGSSFADFNGPQGLETFEPCSMKNFAAYGHWFQSRNVPWVEPVNVRFVKKTSQGFTVTLETDENLDASHVIVATGLSHFARNPSYAASLPVELLSHTSQLSSVESYKSKDVTVIGAGQSALEAVALLNEAGAQVRLLVRAPSISWNKRVNQERSLWQRLRSPISDLGTGPKAWALTRFPGAMHRVPACWRSRFLTRHLPAEGAWWLRDRVENRVPIHFNTTIVDAREISGRVELKIRTNGSDKERSVLTDHVLAGTGYRTETKKLRFLHSQLTEALHCYRGAPILNGEFESSLPGLYFAGPTSAMSFGPLFRFVAGAEYTAAAISQNLSTQLAAA